MLGAALAAATLLASGCGSRSSAHGAPPPPVVLVSSVLQRDVPLYIEAVGGLDGFANVDIRARVRGFLDGQRYADGARVQEGQLLFTIDAAEYQNALASARADLARTRTAQAHGKAQLERSARWRPPGS